MFSLSVANACRHQVNSFLRKKYKTLDEAEDDLGINYFSGGLEQNTACDVAQKSSGATPSTPGASREVLTPLSPIFSHSPHHDASKPTCYGDVVAKLLELMSTMTSKFISALMQTLFWQYMSALYGDEIKKFVPSDFVDLCCKGIHVLNKNGKDNILYYLAKGLGTPRADESGPSLPIDRMPFGLLSYNIRYFALDAVNKVKADPDYMQWESTMFSNFGHKWVCLQRGPGFAYGALGEDRVSEESSEVEVHGTNTVTDDSSGSILQQAWQESFGDDGCISPDTAFDPFDAANQETMNLNISLPPDGSTDNESTCTPSQDVSFLWARLSGQDKEQVAAGDSPTEIEEMHGVRPQPRQFPKKHCDPMKAKVNVAGHSVRTIQRHIQATAFTRDTNIQVCNSEFFISIIFLKQSICLWPYAPLGAIKIYVDLFEQLFIHYL